MLSPEVPGFPTAPLPGIPRLLWVPPLGIPISFLDGAGGAEGCRNGEAGPGAAAGDGPGGCEAAGTWFCGCGALPTGLVPLFPAGAAGGVGADTGAAGV